MGLIRFVAMPTETARAFQRGATDAYGLLPERKVCTDDGFQCRHCLRHIKVGSACLTLAYRPFPELQPYAETGPILLCAEECERAVETDVMPEIYRAATEWLLRGYGHDDRIVYGTGAVTPKQHICTRAHELLQREDVAYLHLRSAKNNCYQCRIERA